MYHSKDVPESVYSFTVEGRLGCVQLFAAIKKAAINIRVQTLYENFFSL